MILDQGTYSSELTNDIMHQRGIIENDESVTQALERATDALLAIDTRLGVTEDTDFASRVYEQVESGVLIFGTPILTNAGREGRMTAACTVLPVQTSQGKVKLDCFVSSSETALGNAIGTGYDLSDVDSPADALLELNEALDEINTALLKDRKRPVASMATLRANHPEVLSFIRAKREADFSKWRFNLSIFVSEELFASAESDELWPLKDNRGQSVGAISAKDLLQEIAECAHYCGEPGILFKDRIDRDNATPQWEYTSTAPCAEVAMAGGEACQFSYINLGNLVIEDVPGVQSIDFERFEVAVRDMTRLLDAAVQQTIDNDTFSALPLVEQKRRIGVGITGFADLLIRLKIPYDDPRAQELALQISEVLDYASKVESVELAKQRGSFPAFSESRYMNSTWVRRKMKRTSGIIGVEKWEDLYNDIQRYGIRHAATTSMPPTGTSSAIVRSSKSLEPHFTLSDSQGDFFPSVIDALKMEEAIWVDIGKVSLHGVDIDRSEIGEFIPYLRTARELHPQAHMDVQIAFQAYLDESLAKTINLPQHSSVADVRDIIHQAAKSGVKGITVFRDNCLQERTGI